MKRLLFILPAFLLFLTILLMFVGVINSLFLVLGLALLIIITFGEFLFFLITEKGALNISTPDGSNQPLHPSVCYTGKEGWNGYKYWMAFTPYPIKSSIYRDRFECPCIIVSNDGKVWRYAGEKEYIDDLTETQISEMDYFSDPELVYIKSAGVLFCYYRLSTGGKGLYNKHVELFRKKTTDGINWSKREYLGFEGISQYKDDSLVSPTIVFLNGIYYLWFVSGKKNQRRIYRMSSVDGLHWNELIECTLNMYRFDPWHIDCNCIEDSFYLTIYDMAQHIVLLKSTNGLSFDFCRILLEPSKRIYSFYRAALYRASLCFDEEEFKLYFSAGNDRKNSIGLMTGNLLECMKVESPPIGLYFLKDFVEGWIEKYLFPFKALITKIVKGKICRS